MTGGQVKGLAAKINGLLPMAFTQKVKDLIDTIPDMSDLVSSTYTSFDLLE
jgi:hypothetical protein